MLDFDKLSGCLDRTTDIRRDRPEPLVSATQGAWQGAYNHLVRLGDPVDVWIVKSLPTSQRHPPYAG